MSREKVELSSLKRLVEAKLNTKKVDSKSDAESNGSKAP